MIIIAIGVHYEYFHTTEHIIKEHFHNIFIAKTILTFATS